MSMRSLVLKTKLVIGSQYHLFCSFPPQNPIPASANLVNEISRILSDHRNPRHDLDHSLNVHSSKISTDLVEQVLKRCKNLGFSAHRFFIWAKRIPGFEHSTASYHILVDILGSSKQFAILWDFLIDMRDSQDCEISRKLFWLIFRAYSKADLPTDAIRAFGRMSEFGLKPGGDDLDGLLYTLCKKKHVKLAQQFFDRVKHRFEPRAKTYSILIRGWGDIGEMGEARRLFDEMRDRGCHVDALAYNSLLEALCEGGSINEAYAIFQEIGSSGVEPNAGSYSVFVRAYSEANDIHSAFRVLDRMRRYDLVPSVFIYNCVIKRLCKNDKVEEAYRLLDEMIERGVSPDTWSYNTIIAYHCEHTEVNRATKLMSRMVEDGCLPDRHSYNMVLKLLVRAGRIDRATAIWESMGKGGFYPSVSTYAVMVHSLCKKNGKQEEACKYFEMMIDDGIPPYSSTIEMLRNRLISLGFVDNVEILAAKMERSTSSSIQEMAKAMRGNRVSVRSRREGSDESETD